MIPMRSPRRGVRACSLASRAGQRLTWQDQAHRAPGACFMCALGPGRPARAILARLGNGRKGEIPEIKFSLGSYTL